VAVTQIYRGAQVLRGFDDEARGMVAEAIRACGVDLHVGCDISRIAAPGTVFEGPAGGMMEQGAVAMPTGRAAAVQLTSGRTGTWDAILFATGRAPNARGFGLDDIGVGFTRSGHVEVNAYSQTAVPSIYALGDVTARPQLTPVAIRDAMAFVATVFEGRPTPVNHDLVASAVFTQPELASIGLTEEAAREREPIEVYATTFRPMRTAFAGRQDRVLMKLIVSRSTRKVLGCHIVAPDAGEMIQLAAIAVTMGATKEDFDRTIAVHPTMAEELVTLRKPVRVA
jgi:glutathione reductase (NADPH)